MKEVKKFANNNRIRLEHLYNLVGLCFKQYGARLAIRMQNQTNKLSGTSLKRLFVALSVIIVAVYTSVIYNAIANTRTTIKIDTIKSPVVIKSVPNNILRYQEDSQMMKQLNKLLKAIDSMESLNKSSPEKH